MKLTSMKLPKKRSKDDEPSAVGLSGSSPREEFPYGLRIRLENEQLAKLGMKLPAVGSTVKLMAEATVTGVEQNARQGEPDQRCVSLQIERLAIGGDKAAESADEALDDGVREASA